METCGTQSGSNEIEVQVEGTKENLRGLLNDLFESTEEGMKKEIPGGATLTLKEWPLVKGVGVVIVITLVLAIPPAVAAVGQIAEYLSKKSKENGVTKLSMNRKEIETTPEGITRFIETTIHIEKR